MDHNSRTKRKLIAQIHKLARNVKHWKGQAEYWMDRSKGVEQRNTQLAQECRKLRIQLHELQGKIK